MKQEINCIFLFCVCLGIECGTSFAKPQGAGAGKPLYRDPFFDGATAMCRA